VAFNRGDKVLCIYHFPSSIFKGKIPEKGKVYTVSSTTLPCGCGTHIFLEGCDPSNMDHGDKWTCMSCWKTYPDSVPFGWWNIRFIKISGQPDEADKADVFETKLLETPKTLLEA